MMENFEYHEACKVVLLGESGVGKTSIISQFKDNIFSSSNISTPGATFVSKQIMIRNKTIEFEIWDTAGQEKYRALTRMFYKDSHVAILVYDITNRESFIQLKDFWLKEVKLNAPLDVILLIVGNKNDLFESEEIPEEEVRKLAEEEKASFAVVSAKNDSGIKELFETIGKQHYAEYFKEKETINEETAQRREARKESIKIRSTKNSIQSEQSNKEKTKGCC